MDLVFGACVGRVCVAERGRVEQDCGFVWWGGASARVGGSGLCRLQSRVQTAEQTLNPFTSTFFAHDHETARLHETATSPAAVSSTVRHLQCAMDVVLESVPDHCSSSV